MDKKRMYRLNAADILIAAAVLALSLTPLISYAMRPATGDSAYIYEDNRLVKQADLSVDGIYKAGNAEIQVSGGRARVLKSDCPHQICAHTGWISSPAQTIVCVPNRILVEIRGNGGQELDAVSY